MATIKDISACIKKLSVMPKFLLQENTPDVWLEVLADIPGAMLEAATLQYLSEKNDFTPVPTAGLLRDKALDLHFLALGVPTAGEAWGRVQDSRKSLGVVFCEDGAKLREESANAGPSNYWGVMWRYKEHTDNCGYCQAQPSTKDDYGHPIITEVVDRLGGRDAVITDNPVADRARFTDAYKEIVLRERGKIGMTPNVKRFVNERINTLLDAGADPVDLIGDGVNNVVANMRRRRDLE